MKGKLLILASAILAGCSNAPSSGDIEKALETAIGPCQNVEIVDVKKTNGYQDDGYYRVEYKFGLEVKERGKLKQLDETWRTEYEQFQKTQNAYAELQAQLDQASKEAAALKEAIGPPPTQNDFPSTAQFPAYQAALKDWERRADEVAGTKMREIEELRQKQKQWPRSNYVVVGKESEVTMNFFYEGCSQQGWSVVRAAIPELQRSSYGMLDPRARLSFEKADLTGAMNMRKTENGWRKM